MVDVYNFLSGKNLCNIFSNLIVEKITSNFPNSKVEVSVINLQDFFVVRGNTSCTEVINLSDLFQKFLNEYDKELSKKIRVIDVIKYGSDIENSGLNINYEEKKSSSYLKNSVGDLLKKLLEEKIYLDLKIDNEDKIIFYSSDNKNLSDVISFLKKNFSNYTSTKKDLSHEIYISDRVFGLSNHGEKFYYLLLMNITKHLFDLGISSDISFSIVSDLKITEINSETVNFKINKGNYITKKEWLESLILDVFDFEYVKLKSLFDGVDLLDYILNPCNEENKVNKLYKISDIILF